MAAGRWTRLYLTALLLAPLAASTPSALSGQGSTGVVTGRIVDAQSQQPVPGVTVTIAGRTAVSRDDGRYLFTGLPAGRHQVEVRVLGYGTATRDIELAAGQTLIADFALEAQAIVLSDIVATGYGQRRSRDVTGSVAQVSTQEFNTGRIVSAEQLIQGKVAGVQIHDTGEPGGGLAIRIRGGTSVGAGNEPLFVVDGSPLPHGGGLSAGRNPLNFLNPDDIETFTVLKDAASTAIYGSRGANGVILITTKSGTLRDPQFAYGNSFSTSRIVRQPTMLSAEQFRTIVQQHSPQYAQHLGTSATDWRGELLQTAGGQEHSFAVAGTGETMNYRLSLGYLDQQGVVRGSGLERASIGINYNHRLLEDRLSVRTALRGARTDDFFTPGGGIGAASIYNPTQPVRTTGGFYEYFDFNLGPNNPVAELEAGVEEGTTYRGLGNIQAALRVPYIEHLTATARVGFDIATSERRTFYPTTLWGQQKQNDLAGYMNRSNPRDVNGVVEIFGNYTRPFAWNNTSLDLTAGHSYETTRGDRPFFELRGLSSDLLGPHGVTVAEETVSRLSVFESRLASIFGRLNYTMLDRYLLTLSVRRDGSSRFGPDNQWGTFPAAAVAWRLSEESFMPYFEALSDLRLRVSWGVNGNQAIGDYLWAPAYRYGDQFTRMQFGNEFITTIRPTAVDRNIKWEETTSTNFALDFGFLDDRFTGAVEYYVKDTDDLLFVVPVPAGVNVSNEILTNVGQMRNRGVEFSINADVLRPAAPRGLGWTTSFVASRNNNELLRLNPFGQDAERRLVGGIAGGVGTTIQVLMPGQPVNTFYVFKHKRNPDGTPVYSSNLLDMYEDQPDREGKLDGVITPDDRVPFQSPAATWNFGASSRMDYRNIDLGFTLRANVGNYVYNNLASNQGYYGRLNEAAGPTNLHTSVMQNAFVEPQYFSEVYVEDASFLRMDNLTLGYTLPSFRGMRNMRLSGTVQNVFTLTGYSGVDPEVGIAGIDNNIYPRSRTFVVGVNVGF
jgi:TonB-dependent starch-binding outer membrane protein SusC